MVEVNSVLSVAVAAVVQHVVAHSPDEQKDLAPHEAAGVTLLVLRAFLVRIELMLVYRLYTLVHLKMLENVLCEQMVRAKFRLSVSI